ncbi:MAG: hypothetical protein AAFQ82_23675 [Myxococcota bacterium]
MLGPEFMECQRSVAASFAISFFFPLVVGASPVEIDSVTAQFDASLGTTQLRMSLTNNLGVPISRVRVFVGLGEGPKEIDIPGNFDAGTTRTVDERFVVPLSSTARETTLEVGIVDYSLSEPATWEDAEALLRDGGRLGEVNFLREVLKTADRKSFGEAFDEIPKQPTVEDARLWVGRVVWALCRNQDLDFVARLKTVPGITFLEDAYGLLRAAALTQGARSAPISAALPRDARRFGDLLAWRSCFLETPDLAQAEQKSTADVRSESENRGETPENRSQLAFWLTVVVLTFAAGIALGRRRHV